MDDGKAFRGVRVLVLGATALAVIGLARSAPPVRDSGSPDAAGSDTLAVLLAGPTGDQGVLRSIDVTFSEPMVPIGARGSRAAEGPIRIRPALQGSFTWVGTTAVSFVLREPPPPATRIVCTIPKGTAAVSGRALPEDYSWTIEYRRPRLLASVPAAGIQRPGWAPASAGHPPEDPFLFAFDPPPAPGAASRIRLTSPRGEIPLDPAPVDSADLTALDARRLGIAADQVLAVRAAAPLAPGEVDTLRIPADLPFAGTEMGLAGPIAIPARILRAPAVLSARPTEEEWPAGIIITLASPTEPESLLAHLRIRPAARHLAADLAPGPEQTRVLVHGDLPAGRAVEVTVTPGVPDFYGRRTSDEFTASIELPHATPRLSAEPGDGVLMPGPHEFVQVRARNTGPVRIRATWILSSEIPLLYAAEEGPQRKAAGGAARRGRAPARAKADRPWESRWISFPSWTGPAAQPDSLLVWRRTLDEIAPRPAQAAMLVLEAKATPTFDTGSESLTARSLLQITNTGISSRIGPDRGILWVTGLDSGRPEPGVPVSLWSLPDSGAPRRIWSGRTGADGIAWTPGRRQLGPLGGAGLARAERNTGDVWLRLSRGWDVERDPDAPNAAFVITDRPLYRPGDTVRWKAFVRRSDASGIHPQVAAASTGAAAPAGRRGGAFEVEAVLGRSGESVVTGRVRVNAAGNADGELRLPEGAETGSWTLSLRIPGPARKPERPPEAMQLGGTAVQVEAYRAPRFEARVETSTPAILSGSTAVVTGRFSYFSGGPLAGLPVQWYLYREPLWWHPKKLEEFSFDDELPGGRWSRDLDGPAVVMSGSADLDAEGRIRLFLPVTLPPEQSDARYLAEVGARDLADQSAFDRTQIDVLRGPLRPGVRALWDDDEPAPGRGGRWQWLVADTSGKILGGVPVSAELVRRDWKTVRIRRVGGLFDYDNTARDTVLVRLAFTSADSAVTFEHAVEEAGYYFLRIALREPDGSSLKAASGRYFSGPQTAAFPREAVQWLSFALDREEAGPNDTLRAILPTPAGGAAGLVLLESGGIRSARQLRLEGTPSILIPLDGLAPPDASVAVLEVGPDRVPEGDGPRRTLPYFAQGTQDVRISTASWRLGVEVTPDRATAAPGDSVMVEIRLRTQDGRPCSGEAALAVVDEAVLALSDAAPPDPAAALFPGRGPGTVYDDTRYFLRTSPLTEKGDESPGGAGSERAAAALRTRFRATAYWNPSIPVGPDGTARVRFRLPDNLTRYRLRATAAATGQLFGSGDARLTVNKPLLIEPAVPRFVRAGDHFVLGAIVENRTAGPLPVRVTCTIGQAALEGPAEWSGTLEAGETRRVPFRVVAGSEQDWAARARARTGAQGGAAALPGTGISGPAEPNIQAGEIAYTLSVLTAAGPGAAPASSDAVARTVPVYIPVDRVTEVAFGRAAPEAREAIRFERAGLTQFGSLRVTAEASLLSDLSGAVDYLIDYPHACLEQIDSRILGLLARRNLADRLPPDTLTTAQIESELKSLVGAVGSRAAWNGFALWPAARFEVIPNAYLDAYTLWALTAARRGRIPVPDELYTNALGFVRNAISQDGRDDRLDPDTRAFATWILCDAGETLRESDLEGMREPELGTSGRICAALAWDAYGRGQRSSAVRRQAEERISNLIAAIGQRIERTASTASLSELHPGWGLPFGSGPGDRVRATALAVLLYTKRESGSPFPPLFVNWLLEQRRHGAWGNTHENAMALEAMRAYAAKSETLRLPLSGTLAIGETSRPFRLERGNLRPAVWSLDAALLERLAAGGAVLDVRAPENAVYYQVRFDRAFPALAAQPQEEGLVLSREYVSAADGSRLAELIRGEPALVHLSLAVPHDADFLVLEDALPAGCEAVNLRLLTSSAFWSIPPKEGDGAEPAAAGSEQGQALQVDYRDIRDDRVRFYADVVPAGVYHLYYPVTATSAGAFGTPGARAGLLYNPEVYGTSEPVTVTIR